MKTVAESVLLLVSRWVLNLLLLKVPDTGFVASNFNGANTKWRYRSVADFTCLLQLQQEILYIF